MDVSAVARHWAETWQSAWPAKQAADIAALYDHTASYRSSPFGEPEPGGALADQAITLAGTTVLRFDSAGLVVDHVDYWMQKQMP